MCVSEAVLQQKQVVVRFALLSSSLFFSSVVSFLSLFLSFVLYDSTTGLKH